MGLAKHGVHHRDGSASGDGSETVAANNAGMDSRRPVVSFIVRVARQRGGMQLVVIDLHSGEALPLRSWDDLWRLLRRLAPGLR